MTDWKPPTEFPNLSGAKVIAYDTETRDPKLREKGPGDIRARKGKERGRVVGVSLGVGPGEGEQWYFPISHLDRDKPDSDNMDPEQVTRFLKDVLETDTPKLGANLLYDMGWLHNDLGVDVGGAQYDILIAEPLIDENQRYYSMDMLSAKYGASGKDDEAMYEWAADAFGGRPSRRQQAKNIWRTPARVVGPYAESDCRVPFEIFEKQRAVMSEESLHEIFSTETRLIPLLHAMRQRGVRVDIERAEQVADDMSESSKRAREICADEGIDVWAQSKIAHYCDRKGIEYSMTEAGNPSFPSRWLENHDDEVLNAVADVRRIDKNCGTFINGTVLDHAVDGRIHCQFNQLKSEEYGTVTGRFSSSNPNLQNIPSRDDELGPLIRSLFLPEPGETWYSADWSQIEYRLLVHYGVLDGFADAIKAAKEYETNPDLSFHKWVAELTGLDYAPAKNMNFGLAYGMGRAKMAADLGMTVEEASVLFNQYHGRLPFVKKIGWNVANRAQRMGFIRTLGGRRRRFHLWEPADFELSRQVQATTFDAAKEQWVHERFQDKDVEFFASRQGLGIKRAYTYKALNSLLQGGAADIMKQAMVEIWEAGLCDVLGAPLSTVHDELNVSVPDTPEGLEAYAEMIAIMNRRRGLKVPMVAESGKGANWAQAK